MRETNLRCASYVFAVAISSGGCAGSAASGATLDAGPSAPVDASSPEWMATVGSPPPATSPAGSAPLVSTLAAPPEAGIAPVAPPPAVASEAGAEEASADASAPTGPPPPISGGTLLMLGDGITAVASDPDRDLVYVVNTASKVLTSVMTLSPGDEPGRLVEDGAGRVHVALRSGGALVTLDPKAGTVVDRRHVCPAPRGLAWDTTTDLVWVACATGELVALPAAGGPSTVTRVIERDLRDVMVTASGLTVSTFRSAELLHLASDGTIQRRDAMPPSNASVASHVAWRARTMGPDMLTLHQEHSLSDISTIVPDAGAIPGAYGSLGSSVTPPLVAPRCTLLAADGSLLSSFSLDSVLPFDLALSHDNTSFAVAGAGVTGTPVIEVVSLTGGVGPTLMFDPWQGSGGGQITAVAFDGEGSVVAQTREPAALWLFGTGQSYSGAATLVPTASIPLSSITRGNVGHSQFHSPTGAGIACASCHPEGGDDGHVWKFNGQPRRTPSLRGTVAGTAPYHWQGDEADFPTLVVDVLTNRMSGPTLTDNEMSVLRQWVESIPAPPAPSWVDAASASRGATLFSSAAVGCATCHVGPKLTNNLTVDVGTGAAFQVPPLVGVGWRTPLLHDGCAATVTDRFGACATTGHGVTASLSHQDVSDLVNYLETL